MTVVKVEEGCSIEILSEDDTRTSLRVIDGAGWTRVKLDREQSLRLARELLDRWIPAEEGPDEEVPLYILDDDDRPS